MHINRFRNTLDKRLIRILLGVILAGMLSGCGFFRSQPDETPKRPEPISKELSEKRLFIPIIYPDRVVELDPRTGQERTIPDEDLIVENGKVWGRYIRLGHEIKFTMAYRNYLCAPTYNTDIETIGDSSRPVRTFAILDTKPDQKYEDCKAEVVEEAVDRIEKYQSEYNRYNQETLKWAPAEVIAPRN